jgi:acyl-coenzyme A thioesterase PaaI-like protein
VQSLLADIGLTTAVVASLPHALAVTTISMTVDHLAETPAEGTLVAVSSAAPYQDGRPQHATGFVHDGTGRQVATVSGWFLPAVMQVHAAERVGLVRERPASYLLDLLGVTDRDAHGGVFGFVAREALSNIAGTLHGGVGALACDLATEASLGPDARLLTSAFSYLRPTPRGGAVQVQASVVRRGRRTATAQCAVVGGDGRQALQAIVVAALDGAGG